MEEPAFYTTKERGEPCFFFLFPPRPILGTSLHPPSRRKAGQEGPPLRGSPGFIQTATTGVRTCSVQVPPPSARSLLPEGSSYHGRRRASHRGWRVPLGGAWSAGGWGAPQLTVRVAPTRRRSSAQPTGGGLGGRGLGEQSRRAQAPRATTASISRGAIQSPQEGHASAPSPGSPISVTATSLDSLPCSTTSESAPEKSSPARDSPAKSWSSSSRDGPLSRYGKPIDALGPGQFLGEMSILDRAAHTATATARTPMRILLAGRENRNVAERARCPASDRDEPGQSTAVLRVPSDRPGHRVVVSETLCLAGIQAITAAEGQSSTW